MFVDNHADRLELLVGRRRKLRRMSGPWDAWLDDALQSLGDAMLLRSLRPLVLPETHVVSQDRHALPTFEGLGPWDRAGVAVEVSHATVDAWLRDSSSTGEQRGCFFL